jgi:hypothetical protein
MKNLQGDMNQGKTEDRQREEERIDKYRCC